MHFTGINTSHIAPTSLARSPCPIFLPPRKVSTYRPFCTRISTPPFDQTQCGTHTTSLIVHANHRPRSLWMFLLRLLVNYTTQSAQFHVQNPQLSQLKEQTYTIHPSPSAQYLPPPWPAVPFHPYSRPAEHCVYPSRALCFLLAAFLPICARLRR